MNRNTRAILSVLAGIALGIVGLTCGQQSSKGDAGGPGDAMEQTAAPSNPAADTRTAEARLEPRGGSQTTGIAHFAATGGEVSLHIRIENAPPGTHAVHIHEVGDCSAPDAKSAGGHWNPSAENHGRWGVTPFHLGDIGNVEVGADGVGEMMMSTDLWTIGGPDNTNVVGRSIIVHAGADDFTSQPTGAAGGRIACGVITPAPR